MPKIVIWMPHDENRAGHVAIATNKYYVSFWPANCLEKRGNNHHNIKNHISNHIGTMYDGVEFAIEVHKGCLVFHQDLDKENEGDDKNKYRDPNYEHEIDAAKVSNEDLNAEIEEFLRYNEINPEDVTLARGKEKYREYMQLAASLPQEEAKLIKDDQKPVKSLAKTKYSIMAELMSSKKDDDSASFYKRQQSCVSFAFNLIQTAWLKHHPNPIPIVNYEEAKNAKEIPIIYFGITLGANSLLTVKKLEELPYKVPWFEKEVVRRYLIITDELINQPIISAQPTSEKVGLLRQVKPTLVSTFVLLLFGYLIPETRYPNVFIFWNFVGEDEVIDDPSILHHFIVPLLIILLAHNWCGVVLSVVIYYVGVFSYGIIKYCLSGLLEEFGKYYREVYRGDGFNNKENDHNGASMTNKQTNYVTLLLGVFDVNVGLFRLTLILDEDEKIKFGIKALKGGTWQSNLRRYCTASERTDVITVAGLTGCCRVLVASTGRLYLLSDTLETKFPSAYPDSNQKNPSIKWIPQFASSCQCEMSLNSILGSHFAGL
ncbi:hypothetical protein DAPPUDRAFT_116317 [Daphnia pulex]|uniref:Uncharacterized protein n=1 Tax=Daphnia pulex TaxID=6669 RepID=E9HP10_DAPPU|nr:hypothetical protein DAPPUDRAFT_116317 [Daphnia pulex]|eukprot:EFX66525.1 hypothetical protein DAPPUDRAFT_116317 [Daphnia pulex]